MLVNEQMSEPRLIVSITETNHRQSIFPVRPVSSRGRQGRQANWQRWGDCEAKGYGVCLPALQTDSACHCRREQSLTKQTDGTEVGHEQAGLE